jgi:hypothetical protein
MMQRLEMSAAARRGGNQDRPIRNRGEHILAQQPGSGSIPHVLGKSSATLGVIQPFNPISRTLQKLHHRGLGTGEEGPGHATPKQNRARPGRNLDRYPLSRTLGSWSQLQAQAQCAGKQRKPSQGAEEFPE